MYLKRLEMTGFKSFPEKIKLEFNKGITAVVGPNGSGKSNISDAVRWVMGEQSAKSLRGAKMEDVIFAGTANRKPLGFAEVAMIIDNNDRALNIDFSEVIITRRVYRSGESEYLLNGATCRLKDIHELFMDTGIGKEGYSIIGQGKIEEILSSKNEDRRQLFEEAAGIVKYKTRRLEALNKLEREKQNLLRITDIIEEIESTLEPLQAQSEKAKQYLALAEQLKLLQVNIFLNEVDGSTEKINKIDTDLTIVYNQINDEDKKKTDIENEIEAIKAAIHSMDSGIEHKNNTIVETRSKLEQSENDIVLKEEQKQHIFSDIENIKSQIEEKNKNLTVNQDEISAVKTQLDLLTGEITNKTEILEQKSCEFDGFNHKMTDEELLIEKLNADIIEGIRDQNEANNSILRTQGLYEQLENRMEQLSSENNNALAKLEEKTTESKVLFNDLENFEQQQEKISASLELLLIEKQELSAKQLHASNDLDGVSKKIHENNYRLKILNELENSFEGYNKSVKILLSQKKQNPADHKGVIGAVGELLMVSKQYETAIEISLGAAVQNVVTHSENDAKTAIEYLKRTNAGRATFLPLNVIKAKSNMENGQILKDKGVIGTAYGLISFEKQYEAVFSSILGRTIVVDSMDTAIVLSKKYSNSYKIVTLDGELFSAGGAITGGSINQKSSGIFSRGREIKQLKADMAELMKKEEQLKGALESAQRQLSAIQFQENESRNKLHEIEVAKSVTTQQYSQSLTLIEEIKAKLVDFEQENNQLMEQIVSCNKEIRLFEHSKLDIENNINEIKAKLVKIAQKITSGRLEKDIKSAEITDLKVEISTITQKSNGLIETLERLQKENNDNCMDIERFEALITGKQNQIALRAGEMDGLHGNVENLKQMQAQLVGELSLFTLKRDEFKQQNANMEVTSKENYDLLLKLNSEKSRLELSKEHIDENLRRLYDTMWEEYEITYQQASHYNWVDTPLNKLIVDEKRTKNSIKELGSVNVGAIEEYKAVLERYEFLTKQSADIRDGEEKLKEIIAQLTQLMEVQFAEHFKIISENFSVVFSEIFGGGTAFVKLTDEVNVLESGIDIVARPPGKSLQNLSLLSGGERALTAMALLFAILRMKPSPFCILDEIESALDDANVVRYANYLQNFCDDTQFILITHRKGVMEAAHVLYGITMQEQGVSTLVSVKFENEIA